MQYCCNNHTTIKQKGCKVDLITQNIGEFMVDALEDSILSWQTKIRKLTNNPEFKAVTYLADKCGVTKGTFYKYLEGDKNRCKLGLKDFKEILVATEDLELLESFSNEVKQEILIKKNK